MLFTIEPTSILTLAVIKRGMSKTRLKSSGQR
jgi:hypothetical protein